jgi:N-formylglutamate amidohydrolase
MGSSSAAVARSTAAMPGVAPIQIDRPGRQTMPFVFVSPHSGANYAPDFLAASRLDPVTLRRSEDCFIDEVFAGAPEHGAPMLKALFPRAYIDPNREPWELDPQMFEDELPAHVNTTSPRVACGLGTIARVVANGEEIYRRKLRFAEAKRRVTELYQPFHAALTGLIEETHARFGVAVIVDCHSMPSLGAPNEREFGRRRPAVVLGDRFGTACTTALTEVADRLLRQMGYSVARNVPYAGGFTTHHYGRPAEGLHALQIEINRDLYMDEERIERRPGLAQLKDRIDLLMQAFGAMDPRELRRLA